MRYYYQADLINLENFDTFTYFIESDILNPKYKHKY